MDDIYTFPWNERAVYQITIRGTLAPHWSTWFDNLQLACDPAGTTTLQGFVADQAALYQIIEKARDLGLVLIAVARIEPDTS
jgi:hypothetical protein